MKNRAFTLAELLISIVVFSLLMIVTYNLFVGGNKQYLQGKSIVESIRNMRHILSYMKKDVDQMVTLKTEDFGTQRKMSITNAESGTVEWLWTKKTHILERIPQSSLTGSRISWGGIKDFMLHRVRRIYDKFGNESIAEGDQKVSAFIEFDIDINDYSAIDKYSEFYGVKIKMEAAKKEQKRSIHLTRYLFPYTASKRKLIKWN